MKPNPLLVLAFGLTLSATAGAQSPPNPLEAAAGLRRAGRNADAASVYEACIRADAARADECRRGLTEVDALLGKLKISVDDPRARVWLDGRELPGFPSGATLRVDPGQHVVAAALGSAPPAQGPVRVGAGETREISLKVIVAAPPPPVAPAAPPLLVTPVVVDQPGPPAVDGKLVAGALLVLFGGLGVATGIGTGTAALVISRSIDEHCLGGGDACDARGMALTSQARTLAGATTVTLALGGAAVIAGSILGRLAAARPRRSIASAPAPVQVRAAAQGIEVVW